LAGPEGKSESAGGRGWIYVAPPGRLFDPADLALYDEVLAHQSKALAAGAADAVLLYDTQEP